MSEAPQLKVKRLHPGAILPSYQSAGAACFDLHAATVDGMAHIGGYIWQASPVNCDTGLAFEIPADHVMLVFSRSGHGFNHDVRLANAVGVVDADYRGSVKVRLTCDDEIGETPPLFVKPGDRIAQALLLPVQQWQLVEVDTLSETVRGDQGLGSTGK